MKIKSREGREQKSQLQFIAQKNYINILYVVLDGTQNMETRGEERGEEDQRTKNYSRQAASGSQQPFM
jgi:hypothetical protein